ncbi:hypothetical protein [Tenacibaculum agarivorans]|uniref:hypothetical protein n=1 Tax=Tenacibaculum agarivorans TaxID=1908389 RepID=UPI00094B7B85|nr:hypothetical protein [Tenacibaculum agarivorans]
MLISTQIAKVLELYPQLSFTETTQLFTGTLEVFPNDFYTISIDISPWNSNFPRVLETGERIPRHIDRHVYDDSGYCCFTTPRLEEIYLKTKVKTLVQFIKHILIPYLQNNSYYELHKTYSNGEFAHTHSTLQSYQTLLGISDPSKIIKILYQYMKGNTLRHSDPCYCGSGRTLRKCTKGTHQLGYDKLQYIALPHLENDLSILWGDYKEHHKLNNNP